MRNRRTGLVSHLLLAVFLFVGNLLLVVPYLRIEYSEQLWNNGTIYLAVIRLFRDHPWTWNALHYCGAPMRYLYPPIMYATVAAMRWMSLAHAFRVVTGFAFAITPVCLYVLAWQVFRSRLAALFAGVAYSLFPSVIYLTVLWRNLTSVVGHAPWAFVTFAYYEEAGHLVAFPMALLALAAMWRERWVLASVLTGLVFLTSWPAVIGLLFPLIGLVAARRRSWLRVGAVVGVGYGLSAFWMTPDYFVSTSLLKRVGLNYVPIAPAPWDRTTWLLLVGALAVVAAVSFLKPELAFVLGWAASGGAVVLAFTWAGSFVVPAPNRCVLELNAGTVLALTALLWAVPWAVRWNRAVVFGLASLAGLYLGREFLRGPWRFFPGETKIESGVAYPMAQWINAHAGESRVFASGEVEETLPFWSDVPELGGTNQDLTNFLPYAVQRYVSLSCSARAMPVSKLWLEAVNVRYAVVDGARSREYYHAYSQPERWAAFPVAFQNGADDRIYDVAGRELSSAVVVDLDALRGVPENRAIDDEPFLEAYVAWARGKRAAAVRWQGFDRAEIDADLGPGEAVLVKSNYAPGWRAAGASTGADPIGFLLLRGAPGQKHFALRFGAAWPEWLGRLITAMTVLLLVLRVRGIWIALAAGVPALAAYVYLMAHVPASVRVAEETYARVEPPQIAPGGIVNSLGKTALRAGDGVTVYGLNFGTARDAVFVWVNGRRVATTFHSANQVQFRMPEDAAGEVVLSPEVNGCRGNGYGVRVD